MHVMRSDSQSHMQGAGIGGSNATCVELGPKAGGLTLASRGAQKTGYQPFGQAAAVQFWLKDKNGSSTIPDLSVRSPFMVYPHCHTKLSCCSAISLDVEEYVDFG